MDRVWGVVCSPVPVLTPVWRPSRGHSSTGAANMQGWVGVEKEPWGWVPASLPHSEPQSLHLPSCPRNLISALLLELLWESHVGEAGNGAFLGGQTWMEVRGSLGRGPVSVNALSCVRARTHRTRAQPHQTHRFPHLPWEVVCRGQPGPPKTSSSRTERRDQLVEKRRDWNAGSLR